MNVKKDIRFRVYLAFSAVCLFGLAILLRAAWIQVKEGPKLRELAREMRIHKTILPAERGNIYTEDGSLLCSSIPQFDLRIDFSVVNQDTFYRYIDTLSSSLSLLFADASKATYKQQLTAAFKEQKRYFLLRNGLAYYQYQAIRQFPIFNKGRRTGGLIAESRIKRINPYGMLAYRSIGLFREEGQTIGIEATFDTVLHGKNGSRIDQKATGGVWMPVEGSEIDPINGRDIVTTIDIGIQEVAEHALMSVLKQYECKYGTVVVMEVPTGKLRALVNLGRQPDGSYWEDLNYALFPTEPGSTFKLATLTALLSDGFINVEDNINCEGGAKQFANRTMHDSHHGLGLITIRNAFAQSSNVGMASLAYKYYGTNPEKYVAQLKRLHLNTRTGIDLIGERRPYLIEPKSNFWSGTSLPWMATGYGIQVSPLHTCMLYNALANNGKMMKPYLVSAIREYGKDVETFEPEVLVDAIASPDAVSQLKTCTEEVVISGTGKHIRSPFYKIAGKTGTAQVSDGATKYSAGVYQGSFVGYFPADNPRYTIAVVIRTKAHSNAYYGGTLAAPVFRMISDKIFASGLGHWTDPLDSLAQKGKPTIAAQLATSGYAFQTILNALKKQASISVLPTMVSQLSLDSSLSAHIAPRHVYSGVVPDVKGLSLKDAVYILENEGLRVRTHGRGLVQGQSLLPGSPIDKGQTIILELS
ncbi:MAG: transpeptidase family protein [Bacteroidetes bacterium]|nr:transpeptidase family protein [Bacteroidota bacterium]MBS1739369.1 transpeptidase family protein [Bacteroidota bacterium]MBS1775755.1 transpeptidase family protein [Bacteroidota bacterium]